MSSWGRSQDSVIETLEYFGIEWNRDSSDLETPWKRDPETGSVEHTSLVDALVSAVYDIAYQQGKQEAMKRSK